MKTNKVLYIGIIAISLLSFGCKKSYLNTSPSTAVTDANLFTNTTGCRSVLDGIGRLMSTLGPAYTMTGSSANLRANDFGEKEIDLMCDVLGADVVCNGSSGYDWFGSAYQWITPGVPTYADNDYQWYFYYKLANSANLILANIDNASGTDADKAEIKGEAYAYRAWCYYKLSIFYCLPYTTATGGNNLASPGLPIYLTPTTATTVGQARASLGDVYTRINTDIDSAVTLIAGSGEMVSNKSYISLPTAYGIYAEIAQVEANWVNAEKYSNLAITTFPGALMDSASYLGGFISATNTEWMWASQLTTSETNDMQLDCFMSFVDATNTDSYAGGANTYRQIPLYLYSQIPTADVRKHTFNATRYNTKFRMGNPNPSWIWDNLYMRLGEMYLIEAEAQAQEGKAAAATTTLETLVKARNSNYTYASTPYFTGTVPSGSTPLLEEIYLQRRIELWLEGKSFPDMVRLHRGLNRPTSAGNFTASTYPGVTSIPADNVKFLFLLPQQELDANPNIGPADQNP